MTKGSMPVSSNLVCFLFNFRGIVFSGRSYPDAIQGRPSNPVPTVWWPIPWTAPFCPQIGFECGKEQTFSEASRPAQEVIFSTLHQLIHQLSLVHIAVASFTEVFKILYAYGIFSDHDSLSLASVYKNNVSYADVRMSNAFPIRDGSRFGWEDCTDPVDLAFVRLVFLGISFFFDLP